MTARLNPYIVFAHSAADALEFYRSIFGGQVSVTRFSEYGLADTPDADKVMHGQIETPQRFTLMCGDTPTGMPYEPGRNSAICLNGDDADSLRAWFEGLSQGGTVTIPLERQMWGDVFGQVVDQFGVMWIVNIDGQIGAA